MRIAAAEKLPQILRNPDRYRLDPGGGRRDVSYPKGYETTENASGFHPRG